MTKKLLSLLFTALLILSVFAGCGAPREVWVSYDDEEDVGTVDGEQNEEDDEENGEEDDEEQSDKTDANGRTSRRKKTTTAAGKTTVDSGTKTRKTKNAASTFDFKPKADAGANYKVKGNVSIAVDTVRSTDYDAMFDVLQSLYPNINFTFDFWAHGASGYDDAREYLATRMSTGTAANVIWDEAGEMPAYLAQGWIEPITKYVAKDPEAKYIPANVKKGLHLFRRTVRSAASGNL